MSREGHGARLLSQQGEFMRRKNTFAAEFKKNRSLFLMILPAAALTFFLAYLPMSVLVLAFKNFRYDQGVFGSPWHGFENFRYLFASGAGWTITRNTIFFNLLNLVTAHSLSILIAIIITEMRGRHYKKFTQSVIILPHFISWVIVGTFVFNIFNYENGVLNHLLISLGRDPINMYSIPKAWVWIICAFNAWKNCGYLSIIYIAAITNVDQECYEAADVDGANIFQKVRHIMLPSILPTIIVMVLLSIGRILRGDFEMFYQIVGNNGQLFNATDVIDTFVFRSLNTNTNLGMTTAANLYQSVLCFVIIMAVNAVIKKVDSEYALF